MNAYEYVASSFLKEESINDILSIRVAADGLSFIIHNDSAIRLAKYMPFETNLESQDMAFRLIRFLKEDTYASCIFKNIKIQIEHKEKLLIPQEVFDAETLPVWMSITQNIDSAKQYKVSDLTQISAKLIAAYSKDLVSFLDNSYANYTLEDSAVSFILDSVKTSQQSENQLLFLDIHNLYLDVLIVNAGSLIYFNSFDIVQPSDALYHTLHVIQDLSIEPTVSGFMSGELTQDTTLLSLFDKYLHNLQLASDKIWNSFAPDNKELSSVNIHLTTLSCE